MLDRKGRKMARVCVAGILGGVPAFCAGHLSIFLEVRHCELLLHSHVLLTEAPIALVLLLRLSALRRALCLELLVHLNQRGCV